MSERIGFNYYYSKVSLFHSFPKNHYATQKPLLRETDAASIYLKLSIGAHHLLNSTPKTYHHWQVKWLFHLKKNSLNNVVDCIRKFVELKGYSLGTNVLESLSNLLNVPNTFSLPKVFASAAPLIVYYWYFFFSLFNSPINVWKCWWLKLHSLNTQQQEFAYKEFFKWNFFFIEGMFFLSCDWGAHLRFFHCIQKYGRISIA